MVQVSTVPRDGLDPTVATVRAYNSMADRYFQQWFNSDVMGPFIARFCSILGENMGDILDAACGVGRDSRDLVKQGFRAIGVDISEELLKFARKHVSGVVFREMNIESLRYPNNSFVGIWCSASLHHVPRNVIRSVIEGFFRVIKPGGVIFVSMPLLNSQVTDQHGRISFGYTRYEIISIFESCGFRAIEITEKADEGEYHSIYTGQWLSGFFEAVKPDRSLDITDCPFCSDNRFPINQEHAERSG